MAARKIKKKNGKEVNKRDNKKSGYSYFLLRWQFSAGLPSIYRADGIAGFIDELHIQDASGRSSDCPSIFYWLSQADILAL